LVDTPVAVVQALLRGLPHIGSKSEAVPSQTVGEVSLLIIEIDLKAWQFFYEKSN
jgi:hypothetical protein